MKKNKKPSVLSYIPWLCLPIPLSLFFNYFRGGSTFKEAMQGGLAGTAVAVLLAGFVGLKSLFTRKPKAGDTYILEDPATGAQSLYTLDSKGQWVSDDGNTILDMDKVEGWKKQRADDRAWQDKSTGKAKRRRRRR